MWSVLSVRGQRWTEGPASPAGQVCASLQDPSGLTASSVRVGGLDPHANYTFNALKPRMACRGWVPPSLPAPPLSINMGSAGEGLWASKAWRRWG